MTSGLATLRPCHFALIALLTCFGCKSLPEEAFDLDKAPPPPNYALPSCWAALPDKKDMADKTPEGLYDRQDSAAVDVFFVHPTTYTGKKDQSGWNGPVYEASLNEKTDETTIQYQASIFNGVGKVYAPRYRQAHLEAYHTVQQISAEGAFSLAYEDVKAAFKYYLEHYNRGRPFIIASHSQGTTHATKLLHEFVDGKPLQEQLVVAYLVGAAVERDHFDFIKVCGDSDEVGCFTSWRTWRKGTVPENHPSDKDIAVTNPLNWVTTTAYAPPSGSKGAVLRNFDKVYPEAVDAQVHEGVLWVDRLHFPWSFTLAFKNDFHIADLNLFYLDVRQNGQERVKAYLEGAKTAN